MEWFLRRFLKDAADTSTLSFVGYILPKKTNFIKSNQSSNWFNPTTYFINVPVLSQEPVVLSFLNYSFTFLQQIRPIVLFNE